MGTLRTPFMNALTAGVIGLVCVATGVAGYPIGRHARFVGAPWSDTVIWWQVGLGFLLLAVAVYFARQAHRKYGTPPTRATVRATRS
jgi:hypothetical protein